jgi:hypothetical protein
MIPAAMLSVPLGSGIIVEAGAKSRVIAPLIAACLAIAIAIPVAAVRSKLHMPGYIGIAILAFVASLLFGEISGMRRIAGSIAGIVLSIACFLSIAVCVGAVLALVFYHDPPEA